MRTLRIGVFSLAASLSILVAPLIASAIDQAAASQDCPQYKEVEGKKVVVEYGQTCGKTAKDESGQILWVGGKDCSCTVKSQGALVKGKCSALNKCDAEGGTCSTTGGLKTCEQTKPTNTTNTSEPEPAENAGSSCGSEEDCANYENQVKKYEENGQALREPANNAGSSRAPDSLEYQMGEQPPIHNWQSSNPLQNGYPYEGVNNILQSYFGGGSGIPEGWEPLPGMPSENVNAAFSPLDNASVGSGYAEVPNAVPGGGYYGDYAGVPSEYTNPTTFGPYDPGSGALPPSAGPPIGGQNTFTSSGVAQNAGLGWEPPTGGSAVPNPTGDVWTVSTKNFGDQQGALPATGQGDANFLNEIKSTPNESARFADDPTQKWKTWIDTVANPEPGTRLTSEQQFAKAAEEINKGEYIYQVQSAVPGGPVGTYTPDLSAFGDPRPATYMNTWNPVGGSSDGSLGLQFGGRPAFTPPASYDWTNPANWGGIGGGAQASAADPVANSSDPGVGLVSASPPQAAGTPAVVTSGSVSAPSSPESVPSELPQGARSGYQTISSMGPQPIIIPATQ